MVTHKLVAITHPKGLGPKIVETPCVSKGPLRTKNIDTVASKIITQKLLFFRIN